MHKPKDCRCAMADTKQLSAEGLLSLPGELLCRVFTPLSQDDLKALSLVNKASLQAVKSAYRNVVVRAGRLRKGKERDQKLLEQIADRYSEANRLSFTTAQEEVDPKALAAFMHKMQGLEDLDVCNLRGVDYCNLFSGCSSPPYKKLRSLTITQPLLPFDAPSSESKEWGAMAIKLGLQMSSLAEALPQLECFSVVRPREPPSYDVFSWFNSKRERGNGTLQAAQEGERKVKESEKAFFLELRRFNPLMNFASGLAVFSHLRELYLERCIIDDFVSLSQKCPSLISLSLTNVRHKKEIYFCDCAMPQLERLKILSSSHLCGCQKHQGSEAGSEDCIDGALKYPKLTSMCFRRSIHKGFKGVASQVTSLELTQCDTLDALNEIALCSQLTKLRIGIVSSAIWSTETRFVQSFLGIQQSCGSLQRVEVDFLSSAPSDSLLIQLSNVFSGSVPFFCTVRRKESSSVIGGVRHNLRLATS